MKKGIVFVILALSFSLMSQFGCGDSLTDLIEADPNTACGRYCIKCSDCKGTVEGYIATMLDATCTIDELGSACELACDQGGDYLPVANIEENIIAVEEANGKKITHDSVSCEEFAIYSMTGEPDGPCTRFCLKCVECGEVASISMITDECSRENGIPCVVACQQATLGGYVETFETYAMDNTDGIDDLSDISCEDFEGTFAKVGVDMPEF